MSEAVSAMDSADALPQLSGLLQPTATTEPAPPAAVTPAQAASRDEARQGHDKAQQHQERVEQVWQRGMDGVEQPVQQLPSNSSTQSQPPPAPLPPHQPLPAADNTAATSTNPASAGPSAYVIPLLSHLDSYSERQAAIIARYRADLLDFDRVAVSPWVVAATRHLKQQESKRELTRGVAYCTQALQYREGVAEGRAQLSVAAGRCEAHQRVESD